MILPEDFALTEAAYTVVLLLCHFPAIRLPTGQKVEILGVEKQTLTLGRSTNEMDNINFTSPVFNVN